MKLDYQNILSTFAISDLHLFTEKNKNYQSAQKVNSEKWIVNGKWQRNRIYSGISGSPTTELPQEDPQQPVIPLSAAGHRLHEYRGRHSRARSARPIQRL
jgi:hypothetical protein